MISMKDITNKLEHESEALKMIFEIKEASPQQ